MAGHNAGMLAMKEIVKESSRLGIEHLTVYAFSTENWKRSEEEVSGIFRLLVRYVDSELRELHENNVRVKILGDYSVIPRAAVERLEKTLAMTCENTGLRFNIALNYGSRAEIVRAVNRIREDMKSGKIKEVVEINEELISRYLYTGDETGNIPDPAPAAKSGCPILCCGRALTASWRLPTCSGRSLLPKSSGAFWSSIRTGIEDSEGGNRANDEDENYFRTVYGSTADLCIPGKLLADSHVHLCRTRRGQRVL